MRAYLCASERVLVMVLILFAYHADKMFLRNAHWDKVNGGFFWIMHAEDGIITPRDRRKFLYAVAFVILATASCVTVQGIEDEASSLLRETLALAEQKFFEPSTGMYCDEFNEVSYV